MIRNNSNNFINAKVRSFKHVAHVFYLCCVAVIAAWQGSAQGADIAFELRTTGVLPNVQGATYDDVPSSGAPARESVFSTNGGILTQDTAGFGANYA